MTTCCANEIQRDEVSCYDSFEKLFNYVKKHDYKGIDLYDGLNSRLFRGSFLYRSRLFRLALIQFCKLSPINFRNLLLVPKGFNSKAGALFLLGNLNAFKITGEEKYKGEAQRLYERLKETVIERNEGVGWGYNCDWQARAFFVPEGTPNIVASVYVGRALVEYYETFGCKEALDFAGKIAEFILNEMIMIENEDYLCFRYIPDELAQVHNANLLAASFLSSMKKYSNKAYSKLLDDKIVKSVNFSIADIDESGSWAYGTQLFHRWVDNFHTAFNIESLLNIRENSDMAELEPVITKITNYYFNNLFTEEGMPKYYNNRPYPIDIHVIAQVLIVLNKIRKSNIAYSETRLQAIEERVVECVKLFQDEEGYFYFQKCEHYWNKIPYIRWGQAWMFYALTCVA